MNAQKLQSSVEGAGQLQLLVNDRDHQIGCHRDPYPRLHRVGTRAVEALDARMFLDPSKEQLDAPSRLVKHGHGESRDLKIVGDEDQFPMCFRVVVTHFSQHGGKGLTRFGELGFAHMIAAQAGEAIHRQRVVPGEAFSITYFCTSGTNRPLLCERRGLVVSDQQSRSGIFVRGRASLAPMLLGSR